jgi:curved DNA-binding protein CbpA
VIVVRESGMAQLDHYQTLEVSSEASAEEIRQACFRLRKAYIRTDPQRWRSVSRAFNVQSDPVLREAYDKEINVRLLVVEERQRRKPSSFKGKPSRGRPPTEILSGPDSKPDAEHTDPHRLVLSRRDRAEIVPFGETHDREIQEESSPEETQKPSAPVDRTRLRPVEPEPKLESTPPAFLQIILKDGTRGRYPLNLDKTTIGRATDSAIFLDDPDKFMSRQHT